MIFYKLFSKYGECIAHSTTVESAKRFTSDGGRYEKHIAVTHRFVKETNGVWYIDLPEFLEKGLGTKNNLMMVAGADTFLDKISNNGNEVTVYITTTPVENQEYSLTKIGMGKDQELLDAVGHAPVDYGAYYKLNEIDHVIWLCPVTEYILDGEYPEQIYIKVVSPQL